ncbi:cyclic nucleotide-binding domain-containing protein [Flavobacterium sp. Sd200]|uniref:Crp/Fnr family transcriptional regulator n=1 Tax=Flavobacterium sp. Sd200 TaxID=2692211 RepID=UPI00136EE73D|nr:Crp/Fnr family transcriptional regulator [Flavobacterium sp. Sd200]MXN91249.1 cyclic nucleotide-binding domain-containing protein [Flavobacterium sp. Sd200]
MQSTFTAYFKEHGIPDTDINALAAIAKTRTLRRNELLLQAGEVCRHKIFIVNGLLRTFTTGTNGNEHILHFSPEHTWTLDVESFDKETPSAINIAATEPTEVMLWRKNDFNSLLAEMPELKNLAQQLISRNIYNSRQRILTAISATPEEKYDDFMRNYPGLLSRLPLHMIASYMGISLKTLTRIRHAQLHR